MFDRLYRLTHPVPAIAAGAIFALCLSGAAQADHAHHSSAKTVLAALTGATVEGEDAAGITYRITYADDGKATLTRLGATETGTWSVDKGGHYCETWPAAFGGGKKCTGVEVIDNLIVLRGKIATTRTILPKAP